jgi:hypothetical protein
VIAAHERDRRRAATARSSGSSSLDDASEAAGRFERGAKGDVRGLLSFYRGQERDVRYARFTCGDR